MKVYTADSEMQGWYVQDNQIGRQRVRISIGGQSLCLHSLTGAVQARWSLDQLENDSIPILGRNWIIKDRRVHGPLLTLENDEDYAVIRRGATDLFPLGTRTWRQLLLTITDSVAPTSNIAVWLIAALIVVAGLAAILLF